MAAFSAGRIAEDAALSIGEHLDSCHQCRDTLDSFGAVDHLTAILQVPPPHDEYADEPGLQHLETLIQGIGSAGSEQQEADVSQGDEPVVPNELGQYRLLERIGAGGMGAVYRASHRSLGRTVAVKLLPPQRTPDEKSVGRFLREMQAIGKLDHPNIVRATDGGEINGIHYLVMELLDGIDLSALVRSHGPLPVPDACELVRQIAHGLHYAHRKKLIHRDIKPSNIMLSRGEDGRTSVKLLDLGLAFLFDNRLTGSQELTETGQMMGTIDYMAPEQGDDSSSVDERADIYSLGATLYKLLCGNAPFDDERLSSPLKKLRAIATQPAPSLGTRRDDLPPELISVVDQMLARSPSERTANAKVVAEALAPFCRGHNLSKYLALAAGEGGNQIDGPSTVWRDTPPFTETRSNAGASDSTRPTAEINEVPLRGARKAWQFYRSHLHTIAPLTAMLTYIGMTGTGFAALVIAAFSDDSLAQSGASMALPIYIGMTIVLGVISIVAIRGWKIGFILNSCILLAYSTSSVFRLVSETFLFDLRVDEGTAALDRANSIALTIAVSVWCGIVTVIQLHAQFTFPASAGSERRTGGRRKSVVAAVALLAVVAVPASFLLKNQTRTGAVHLHFDQPGLAGAVITIDSQKRATLRSGKGRLKLNVRADGQPHVLRVTKRGFKQLIQDLTVSEGSSQTIDIRLDPILTSATAPSNGKPSHNATETQQPDQRTQPADTDPPKTQVSKAKTIPASSDDSETYRRATTSTSWILARTADGTFSGAGLFVDRNRRLVVTTTSVVRTSTDLLVLFPDWTSGSLPVDRRHYLGNVRELSFRGRLVATDEKQALALIQLDKEPEHALVAEFATEAVSSGAVVLAIGHPPDSESVWLQTTGIVRQALQKQFKTSAGEHDYQAVEVLIPHISGFNGAPVLNSGGAVVGMIQAIPKNANDLAYAISAEEIQRFVLEKSELLDQLSK